MVQALFSLDGPRPLSKQTRTWGVVLLIAYAVFIGIAVVNARDPWSRIPATGLVHAWLGAYVSAMTALLMTSHARITGRRGFQMIAGTFTYLAVVLLFFPCFYPGSLVPDGQLLGGIQSAPTLFFTWHLAFPIGLAVGAWMIYSDQRNHRRPDLTRAAARRGVVVAVLGAFVTLLLAAIDRGEMLPHVVTAYGEKTAYGRFLDVLTLLVALGFLFVALRCSRNGSVIGRWLFAIAVLTVGEAVLNLATIERYELGWYVSRVMWLAAISVLFASLVWNLSRISRANSELVAFDELTGAQSRTAFLDAIHRELDLIGGTDRQIALLWVDLDGFKGVNDQLGHPVGDELLRRVTERLMATVRVGDRVGRLGGDEFGVLLCDDVSPELANTVAERLLAAVREPLEIGDAIVHVGAAIGIATAPSDATTADDLLQCADLAMYAAKARGGDCYQVFNEQIGRDSMAKARMRHELAESLREEDFLLFYQPIFVAEDMRMAGAEVLARWLRNGEEVSAGSFVPFAEETGQIVGIGRVLLSRLAQEFPLWLDVADDDFFLTVNLSVRELSDVDLVDYLVSGPLSQYAHRLVIEVTESLELHESSEADSGLSRIRAAGIRVAIDDFGAGFSNFAQLERLRPSLLKIDRSLVQRAGTEFEGGIAFLTAAASVAASLNCDVVAEGVERQVEANMVSLLGIRYVQGYLYGRPGPVGQFITAPST